MTKNLLKGRNKRNDQQRSNRMGKEYTRSMERGRRRKNSENDLGRRMLDEIEEQLSKGIWTKTEQEIQQDRGKLERSEYCTLLQRMDTRY